MKIAMGKSKSRKKRFEKIKMKCEKFISKKEKRRKTKTKNKKNYMPIKYNFFISSLLMWKYFK